MTQQSGYQGKAKEISLGEDFGDVAVKVNGVRVEVTMDGNVKISLVANDDDKAAASTEPKIGDKMPDGTVFAGISPETNKPMYATPADASLTMTFNDAKGYAALLDAHGHRDWHVPTKAELNALFNNRAEIGGFNVSGAYPDGWYWSSSQSDRWLAWGQRFSDGAQLRDVSKFGPSSLRCVR